MLDEQEQYKLLSNENLKLHSYHLKQSKHKIKVVHVYK